MLQKNFHSECKLVSAGGVSYNVADTIASTAISSEHGTFGVEGTKGL